MDDGADDVRVLLAKQAVHDTLMRYCRGVDRGDAELIASAFHADAITDDGVNRGPSHDTIDGIVDGLSRTTTNSSHFIGNVLVEVEGDTAFSEAYFISYLSLVREGISYTRARGGRYVDRFERRDGAWRIALRVMVDDWSRLDPVGEIASTGQRFGRRSHDDPVWTIRDGAFDAVRA